MTDGAWTVTVRASTALTPAARADVLALCHAAYDEDLVGYLEDIGPGVHLLGHLDGRLVSHLMLVPRRLETSNGLVLPTAYVELVATAPDAQGRGHASALLARVPDLASSYALAALSPSDEAFYARRGWTMWRGPLGARTAEGVTWFEDESVMVQRTPITPAALDVYATLTCEWRPGEVW